MISKIFINVLSAGLVLAVACPCGAAPTVSHSVQANQSASYMVQVKKQASAIKAGMSRAEVEKVFRQQDGGLMSSDLTRYYAGNGVMVDVPFDMQGGAFSPRNRVSGPLKVYSSSFHPD